jgi:hypothetical protein
MGLLLLLQLLQVQLLVRRQLLPLGHLFALHTPGPLLLLLLLHVLQLLLHVQELLLLQPVCLLEHTQLFPLVLILLLQQCQLL